MAGSPTSAGCRTAAIRYTGDPEVAMTASIEAFEQAMKLDTGALRGLLASARPEQRVWAMWALALRQHGVPDLVPRTAVEPDPGVRRTLAVILASHGETDLLVALARHDPAIAVRASAMQLVTRLAAGGQIDCAVVREAAQREPEIQAAILAALDARAPEPLVAIAVHLVQHGAPELQVEAFEALVRIGTPVGLQRALAWLGSAGPPHAVEACRRWARAETPEAVVRMLASAPAELRAIALQGLRDASWSVVEPLADGDRAVLLRAGYHTHPQLPLAVLAQLVVDDRSAPALAALVKRLEVLATAPPELAPLVPGLDDHALGHQRVLLSELLEARAAARRSGTTLAGDGQPADTAARARRMWQVQDELTQLVQMWRELRRLCGEPLPDAGRFGQRPRSFVHVPGVRASRPREP